MVWGPGLLGPLDETDVTALSALLKPHQGMRIAHVGAELGGASRALERAAGCRVIGLETDPRLVAAAVDGGGDVQRLDPRTKPTNRPFHYAVIDGLLHRAGDFEALLRRLRADLGEQATIILRGYVLLDERAIGTDNYRSWVAAEPFRPRLMTIDEIGSQLQHAGFKQRAGEDRSADHVAVVERAWRAVPNLVRRLHHDPTGRLMIPLLLEEGELWQRRLEFIRDRIMAYYQIVATRRDRRLERLNDI